MQILSKTDGRDVQTRCRVCGQGFVLFQGQELQMKHAEALKQIDATLRDHHRSDVLPDVHPEYFLVPEWSVTPGFYGAAPLGGMSEMGKTPEMAW
jgi:hypothetical protein